jgi:membrane-associated phospholipid phosphatase
MRDLGVTQALAPQVPEALVPVLVVLTFFGGPKVVAVAATAGSGLGVYRDVVDRRTALRFLAVVALVLGVSLVLKNGLALPRPPTALHRIPEDGFGFPSGHATATAGIAFALAGLLEVGTRRARYAAATVAVAVIAATRVLLGVHYLLDVVVGALVGFLVVRIGLRLSRRRLAPTVGMAVVAVGFGFLLRLA